MAIDPKLLEAAINRPNNLDYADLVRLAEQMGWVGRKTEGNHQVFRHPNAHLIKGKFPQPLNFQARKDGKAKSYQVGQLLDMARSLGIINQEV